MARIPIEGYVERLTAPRIRGTLVIMDVLDVIVSAPQDDPARARGSARRPATGRGTVYPALDRLMKAGWIEDRWNAPLPVFLAGGVASPVAARP